MIEYDNVKEFQREIHFVNPPIGGFVTSYGRLWLYEVLEVLGERCCYMDTDSAIWVGGAKMNDLVQMGHYLGDLENELKGDNYIQKFVSLGCKTYTYVTQEGKSIIKAKGFSLKNIKVDFDDFDKIIESERESQVQNNVPAEANVKTFEQFNIRREKNTQSLYNLTIQKDLKFTFDKRVLCFEDLTTRPYGY